SARGLAAIGLWTLAWVAAAVAVAWWVPKGAYLAYAAACIAGLALPLRAHGGRHLLPSGYLSVVAGIGLAAWHWGGSVALERAAPVMARLAAAGLVRAFVARALWPHTLRWQASAAASFAVAGAAVGVLAGGAYMSERFSTSGEDM